MRIVVARPLVDFAHARRARVVASPEMLSMMRHERAHAERGTAGAVSTFRVLISTVRVLIAITVAALCVHRTWAIWHRCAHDLLLMLPRFEERREAQSLIYANTCRELGGDASVWVGVKPLEVQHQVGRKRC